MRIPASFHHHSRRDNPSGDNGTGNNQKDQLHAHKPKVIPRPGRQRGAEKSAISGASGQVAQVFGTHSTKWPQPLQKPQPSLRK
jgi:hypothetical protein